MLEHQIVLSGQKEFSHDYVDAILFFETNIQKAYLVAEKMQNIINVGGDNISEETVDAHSSLLSQIEDIKSFKDKLAKKGRKSEIQKKHVDTEEKKFEKIKNFVGLQNTNIAETVSHSFFITKNERIKTQSNHQKFHLHRKSRDAESTNSNISLAKTCTKAFFGAMPPTFCMHSPAPTKPDCPKNFSRTAGVMCQENCKSNYIHTLGVCWEQCPSGYRDWGITCKKNGFNLETKR